MYWYRKSVLTARGINWVFIPVIPAQSEIPVRTSQQFRRPVRNMRAGSDGVAHPVWTDFRGNPNSGGTANQDAYTQAFTP